MHKLFWILLFAYAGFCLFWTIRRAWKFYEKKVRPEWPFAWRLAFWVSAALLGALAFVVSPILQLLWFWHRFVERPTILYYNKMNGVTAVMRESVYNLEVEMRIAKLVMAFGRDKKYSPLFDLLSCFVTRAHRRFRRSSKLGDRPT